MDVMKDEVGVSNLIYIYVCLCWNNLLGGPIAENGLAIARSEGRIWYLGHQTARRWVMTQEGLGGATPYRERVSSMGIVIGARALFRHPCRVRVRHLYPLCSRGFHPFTLTSSYTH
jgi:hypothetical protein